VLFADVNLYLHAFLRKSEHHPDHRKLLEDWPSGDEPFGLSELVLRAFVRIVTNYRV
jgi:predicted nucleic acid-binding protein